MIHYYRKLLAEPERIRAFRRGIESVVGPDTRVCEIGTGLGTYAFFASRAGASIVYAIEETAAIELARKFYADNCSRLGEIRFIRSHSCSTPLPEKVDVILYENFDSQGLLPDQERVLADARQRFLKPGGCFVPNSLALFWVPLQAEEIWRKEVACLADTNDSIEGVDFSRSRFLSVNSRVQTQLGADFLLAEPKLLDTLDLRQSQRLRFNLPLEIDIRRQGVLHGFGSWVDLGFIGGHQFSLSFEKPATTYSRAFFPMPEPVPVNAGDRISMRVGLSDFGGHSHVWTWQGHIEDTHGLRLAQWQSSTLHGTPFAADDAHRARLLDESKLPQRSIEGDIRLFVLKRMDGRSSIERIARDLQDQFPESIPTLNKALARVARIVKKCGRINFG